MSIQPNRVVGRIIEQVEKSNWPRLESKVHFSKDRGDWTRSFNEPVQSRYATIFHFWVHALRDDLAACSRVADLEGAAGYALCRGQSFSDWKEEICSYEMFTETSLSEDHDVTIYRMQGSECRKSSVALIDGRLLAHFWTHGFGASWRREAVR